LQDEEIPTEERYEAIVKLYKMEFKVGPTLTRKDFSKKLGINEKILNNAFSYCKFVEEEPETAKKVAPHIIIETASLPKEERMEVLKEFEGTKDKKKDMKLLLSCMNLGNIKQLENFPRSLELTKKQLGLHFNIPTSSRKNQKQQRKYPRIL
jgi:hypothetical protein